MSSFISDFANHSTALTVGKSVTVASIGIFTGVALSFNALIMPSCRKVLIDSALPVWAHSYNTAKKIQIGLIVTSSITAATIYKKTENPYYLAGSLIMGSILPYTYAFIMPINWTLLDILDGKKTGDVEQLLLKWDMFHVARTIAGLTSLGLILYGELSGQRVIALR